MIAIRLAEAQASKTEDASSKISSPSITDPAATAAGTRTRPKRSARAADRRNRPHRRGVEAFLLEVLADFQAQFPNSVP